MDKSSRILLLKVKQQQKIKKSVTVVALALFILQLGFLILGLNHPYENSVIWGLLGGSIFLNGEIFGITKNQVISELEKVINESVETFDTSAHNKQ
jgi:hypothetical protein